MSTEKFPTTDEEIADLIVKAKQEKKQEKKRKKEEKFRELLRNLIEKFNEMLKALMQHKLVTLEILHECSENQAEKAIQSLREKYPNINVDNYVTHNTGFNFDHLDHFIRISAV